MQYRYHPIIENLKVNEDGSEILMNGEPIKINVQKIEHMRTSRKVVSLNRKVVNTIRLVCEAWHGIAPTGEHAARRIDETKGDHYSNLYWGKKGMTLSSAKGAKRPTAKMSATVYSEIMERTFVKSETIKAILKELDISANRFYQYQKKHGKEN